VTLDKHSVPRMKFDENTVSINGSASAGEQVRPH
jgi:hypothetical protein